MGNSVLPTTASYLVVCGNFLYSALCIQKEFKKNAPGGMMPKIEKNDTTFSEPLLSGDFISQICAYFRDFLDTDFRRQKMPKRAIGLKDARGNLTGISIAKYPELVADLWTELAKPIESSRKFSFTASRNKYRTGFCVLIGSTWAKIQFGHWMRG